MSALRLAFGCLAVAAIAGLASAEQECPGRTPWRLKCPDYCCVEELDEPLEGQYCCSACRSSFDAAVRNSFPCTAKHYLQQTWAVVLMACGIAFVVLVCCSCCCCCCCAPCRERRRRRHSRSYSLGSAKHPRDYGGVAVTVVSTERGPLLTATAATAAAVAARPAPSAPPATRASAGYPEKAATAEPMPPPYQASAGAAATVVLPPPPVYQP